MPREELLREIEKADAQYAQMREVFFRTTFTTETQRHRMANLLQGLQAWIITMANELKAMNGKETG